jgi:uncharacterized protein (UPF0548 family)
MVRMLTQLQAAQPTYPQIGFTLIGKEPTGFRNDTYETDLGRGTDAFDKAVHGLRTWAAHRVPGIAVFPRNADIVEGTTVIVTLGTPIVAIAAPCRIVGVLDEPHRWGFAYGTLPGHPEQGEEAFVVSIDDDETVKFRITALSRPGDRTTRPAVPIARAVQKAGTNGYVKALKEFVDRAE